MLDQAESSDPDDFDNDELWHLLKNIIIGCWIILLKLTEKFS
jgi:hypothetical protein